MPNLALEHDKLICSAMRLPLKSTNYKFMYFLPGMVRGTALAADFQLCDPPKHCLQHNVGNILPVMRPARPPVIIAKTLPWAPVKSHVFRSRPRHRCVQPCADSVAMRTSIRNHLTITHRHTTSTLRHRQHTLSQYDIPQSSRRQSEAIAGTKPWIGVWPPQR